MLVGRFAAIANAVSRRFGGPYHDGLITLQRPAQYDDGGSIFAPGGVEIYDCRVQVDSVTEAMRSEAGFTDKDVRLLILGDEAGPTIDTDAVIEVLPGDDVPAEIVGTYSVQSVGSDPFAIYRECRGRRA